MENTDVHTYGNAGADKGTSSFSGSAPYGGDQYSYSGAQHAQSPGAAALRWVKQHPLLCAAAVAAVVAIGPRRIMRSAVTGGTALTTLTLRNPSNINMLTRLISQVANYVQTERGARNRP